MAVYRFAVDVKTDGEFNPDKAQELLEQFANGVVADLLVEGAKYDIGCTNHIHKSTRDYACDGCIEIAQDRLK